MALNDSQKWVYLCHDAIHVSTRPRHHRFDGHNFTFSMTQRT
ncbi:Uncharacterised protein [Salmonella enterica subsp. enterica serovar Typhi]|nr:Uncharacterised protein [Salmonella enterica subsp. enterica serovar Typhi]CRJ12029.1 Uncharacterised protein [Salmonella enterica subsp. enterica serovar Typhi]VAL71486.1 Uncharacterised protein [Enterobacter kobei]